MAILTNTQVTYSTVGNREDLENIIYNISPTDTPFYSMIGSQKVTAVKHEWQLDALATPSASNAQLEGDEYSFSANAATTRVANMAQISRKEVIVSGTQEAVTAAGRDSDRAYQVAKKGLELKKDIEAAMLSNNASVVGNSTTARVSGGFGAWVTTNDQRGASGADGGWNGTLVAAPTNGTQRAFTKALLDAGIQAAYQSGGNPTTVIVSPYNKRVFSSFMSDANVAGFKNEVAPGKKQGTIMAAADAYLSDFGLLNIVPDRVLSAVGASSARNVYIIDPEKVARGVLRPTFEDDPAKTGDALKSVLLTEWTLVMKNEAAHSVIYDTFGLTSAS